ncbi:MAG TPA: hypothetical protein VFE30_19250 [Anaeromyxobacteraceae bacterium]|jgi:hypothetical protein|nr:hypothetical protein [Anaeromyxobacteraceae bacterium]
MISNKTTATATAIAIASGLAMLSCSGGTSSKTTQPSYLIGGVVTGLASSGLTIHGSFGEDLAIAADGPFAFATRLASGTSYSAAVTKQPGAPAQTCTVTGGDSGHGSGTVASADVTSLQVTCTTNSYTVGGNAAMSAGPLTLQLNGANDLTMSSAGAFSFASSPLPSGATYAVTVKTPPPGQACTVAGGAGTVGAGNVTSVTVTCSGNGYTVGGNASMPFGPLVLQLNGGNDLTASASGSFTFPTPVALGAGYAVTVKTPPQGQACTVTGGSGTMGAAAVTSIVVSCSIVVVAQRWEAPTTWGAVWQDDGHMVEHAYFGPTAGTDTAINEQTGVAWSLVNGPLGPPKRFDGFPSFTRWGAGPFSPASGASTSPRYQATANDGALDLPGDMLVCAIVKPDYDPTDVGDGQEKAIFAKGVGIGGTSQPGGGWVLMQMHSQFCFHYQGRDSLGNTFMNMAYTPTGFADQGMQNTGPLNPTFVVVCAGRSGNQIFAAANNFPATDIYPATLTGVGAVVLDSSGGHHATIGGYDTNDLNHVFPGRVYETAVWAEPATPQNVQAKFAAVEGLAMSATDPTPVDYTRNREGPFTGVDGGYHTTWRNGPRIDPVKGFLFGLQGWNRVSYCTTSAGAPVACGDPAAVRIVAAGEALDLWTASPGATVLKDQLAPPGDSEKPSAELVTLAPGASLSAALGAFEAPGPVHGQIWLLVPSATAGSLQVTTSNPALSGGVAGTSRHDVDLGSLVPNAWTRVWLNGLTTDGAAGTVTLTAASTNSGPITFDAWGVDLTQIGGGGDLGSFDPGLAMYDWSGPFAWWGDAEFQRPQHSVDVVELPPVPTSTASTGFCLSVDAQPFDGLSWMSPFKVPSGMAAWIGDAQPVTAQLFSSGAGICFLVTGATGSSCWAPAWAAGSKHNVKGCLSASGQQRLYADDIQVGNTVSGIPVPDLASGHLAVGNNAGADSTKWSYTNLPSPWNGFISKALACRDVGVGASTVSCQ